MSTNEGRTALALQEGDPAAQDRARDKSVEQRLEKLPAVEHARLTWVCCNEGKAILFVGIQEKGAPQLTFRSLPTKRVSLPAEAVALNRRFDEALQAGA